MPNIYRLLPFALVYLSGIYLSGCSSQPQDNLGSLDIIQEKKKAPELSAKPRSEEDIKSAYYNYIKNAPVNDKSRRVALNRLAELEMKRLQEQTQQDLAVDDEGQGLSALQKSKDLLQTSLRDFPDNKDNDKTLYQLARIQDQLGETDDSLLTLTQLCQQYPTSPYYAEAQFRVAENAFIRGDYITAEAAYTEIIFSRNGESYLERALFKRGWTRYKQGIYSEAADDYLAAIEKHQFADLATLAAAEKEQFNEYFRALGLSISSLASLQDITNYFAGKSSNPYLFNAYEVTSNVFLEQERFSDAALVMDQFIAANPTSSNIPFAHLQKLNAWQQGNFKGRFTEALEIAYTKYKGSSSYWHSAKNPTEQEKMLSALRPLLLQAALYAQEDYQQTSNPGSFTEASRWYKRYLDNYQAYAQQDKVYRLFAELLASQNQHQEALRYFELAAYDGDIILNKEAAYATIVLSNTLYEQDKLNPLWLNKHLDYTLISARLYATETRYHNAALHAAELALSNQRYAQAINLSNSISAHASDRIAYQANMLKGRAYLQSKSFVPAEIIFTDLLKQTADAAQQQTLQNQLALSIYQQAEAALANQRIDAAVENFARIAQRAPASDIAPKALYEAVALSMKQEQWTAAIGHIQQLQRLYPKHELNKDATRQLSIAYLNAGDGAKAAQTFEQIAAQESNQDVKMATLWKAAELYEEKHNLEAAIRSYTNYVDQYTRPFPQYMEAMYKLTNLHRQLKDTAKVDLWQAKIAAADAQAAKALKTGRTHFIAADAHLNIAKKAHGLFSNKYLVEPLAENLKTKKKLMQEAISAYGQAATYDNPAVTTEATFAIGNIYQEFSKALLKSERPKNLKGEELEQYTILLEDQAFPFEAQAIEFYEINLGRIKEGFNGPWIAESYQELKKLFPVRYNKTGKADIYYDETL